MKRLPAAVQRYLDKQPTTADWRLEGDDGGDFAGAVVIPSLAEGECLFATLRSLAANPAALTQAFLVVVVVNHEAAAAAAARLQNSNDLERLQAFAAQSGLRLAWVDAASPGLEIPTKLAGVGFARKLGMDLVLPRLLRAKDPLLVCLDADTLVETGYLQAIITHFLNSTQGAAILPYRHQPAADAVAQAAIERYELFLRSYVYGLRLAGSPYAFNSVGSAMACRASAYVRCGGMNSRKAGEDFYFLQKLAKTGGVAQLSGTTVYPEARVSTRVPFGTGRSMSRLLEEGEQAIQFYPVEVFRVLAEWLDTVQLALPEDAEQLMLRAAKISPVLSGYLEQCGWQRSWTGMQATYRTAAQLFQAFHVWFDGFRTMRLVHLLCEAGFGRGEPETVLPRYFFWQGRSCPATCAEMLEELRSYDAAQPLIRLSKI